jgi:4-hydroxy-tetrahydrodipicolinate reductase
MDTWTTSNPLRICLAGITGWTGRALCAGILADPSLRLTGAVARSAAGKPVHEALGASSDVRISASVKEALAAGADVLVDYTSSSVVKSNALAALELGVSVVIGTSGLTAADFAELEKAALARGRGVIASGNFSVTAALATRFALMAARYLPRAEVLEYYPAGKTDVPSGTVRELAERLAPVRTAAFGAGESAARALGNEPKALAGLKGPIEARGAEVSGTRVHSVRMDSYVSSFEVLFGLPNERLVLKHESGSGAEPYVAGTLLAARRAPSTKGLLRGLDNLMFGPL